MRHVKTALVFLAGLALGLIPGGSRPRAEAPEKIVAPAVREQQEVTRRAAQEQAEQAKALTGSATNTEDWIRPGGVVVLRADEGEKQLRLPPTREAYELVAKEGEADSGIEAYAAFLVAADPFHVLGGSLARIVETSHGDLVRVLVETGSMTGRVGWAARERVLPAHQSDLDGYMNVKLHPPLAAPANFTAREVPYARDVTLRPPLQASRTWVAAGVGRLNLLTWRSRAPGQPGSQTAPSEAALLRRRSIFALEAGTRVQVLEVDARESAAKVAVLGGREAGSEGWIDVGWILGR